MDLVKVESRRDYELYIKNAVAKLTVSNKVKAAIRKISMQCFDDGIKFSQNDLKIEVIL